MNLKALSGMTDSQLEFLEGRIKVARKEGFDMAVEEVNTWSNMLVRVRNILAIAGLLALILLILGGFWSVATTPQAEVEVLFEPERQWSAIGQTPDDNSVIWVREVVPGVKCYKLNHGTASQNNLGCVKEKEK